MRKQIKNLRVSSEYIFDTHCTLCWSILSVDHRKSFHYTLYIHIPVFLLPFFDYSVSIILLNIQRIYFGQPYIRTCKHTCFELFAWIPSSIVNQLSREIPSKLKCNFNVCRALIITSTSDMAPRKNSVWHIKIYVNKS